MRWIAFLALAACARPETRSAPATDSTAQVSCGEQLCGGPVLAWCCSGKYPRCVSAPWRCEPSEPALSCDGPEDCGREVCCPIASTGKDGSRTVCLDATDCAGMVVP